MSKFKLIKNDEFKIKTIPDHLGIYEENKMKIENPKKVILYLLSGLGSIILFFLITRKKEAPKTNDLDQVKTEIKTIKDNSEKMRNEFNEKIKKAVKNGKPKPIKPIESSDDESSDDSESSDS